jgi:hypothetical protein
MARQVLTSLVIVAGVVVGWGLRKATGPTLVSEQVDVHPVRLSGPRPAAVATTDPVARAWLAEASSVAGPSASLMELKRALAAGEISDFGRLARAMLTHPLPMFRSEALSLVLPAWGEKDPAEAVRFAAEHEPDLVLATDEKKMGGIVFQLGMTWVRSDPEAALRYGLSVPPGPRSVWLAGIWQGVLAPGAPGSPGLIERLKLVASIHGEQKIADLWSAIDYGPPFPSATEWRDLAASATTAELKARYQNYALANWRAEQGPGATADEARRWMGQDHLPANVESFLAHMGSPGDMATFLRSGAAGQLPEKARDGLFGKLLREDPEQAQVVFAETGGASWFNPATLARSLHNKPDDEVRAWLGLIPDAEKRQKLVGQLVTPQGPVRTAQDLTAAVDRALRFGPDGEAGVVAALTDRSRVVVQQVPDVFAALPPEVQVSTRLEVVLGLGRRSPDVAAELWMDATPAELAQPGAAVVAEELAGHLLARDSEVGSAWIRQLPPGESRDRAVARLIEHAAADDPATSAEWAATLVDPAARTRAEAALRQATSPSPAR